MECALPCGQCQNGTFCNDITGYCPEGCQEKWQGKKCDGVFYLNKYTKVFCVVSLSKFPENSMSFKTIMRTTWLLNV